MLPMFIPRSPLRRALAFLAAAFLLLVPAAEGNAAARAMLPPEVQSVVTQLLAMQNPSAPLPDKAALDAFLAYTTSPLSRGGVGEEAPAPEKLGKASGIFWRSRMDAPLATTLEYLYNPKVPVSVVYPASIRYALWLPGSDILALTTPLWEQLGGHADKPLVLRGTEFEEITPDTNSGAYYKYLLDRVLILTEFQEQRMLISVSVQQGKSDTGKKAAFIGDYSDWDFVYSGAVGTLAGGIGWAETFIYSAASIIVFYEDAPGGKQTGYAMYRWMDAGWSGLNMVKPAHISAGAERSFAGIKFFMESPRRPPASVIAAYAESLKALDAASLRQRFAPYSAKVEEAAKNVEALRTDDFQKVIKGGGYGKSMGKEYLIAALCVNFVKEKLGKATLAGPLGGDAPASTVKAEPAGRK
ncbi:MAG: hypothetical protein LBV01_01960 [Deltaproteobacteria bacterium]|nr:hypothetical protein [Deltaproteobacteria bacterium]